MSNSVAASRDGRTAMAHPAHMQEFSFYTRHGARKYLNQPERRCALAAMGDLKPQE
jgi:hypothetical protein